MKKVVFITGASSGIGYACAQNYAADGCDLILVARREDKLQKLKVELQTKYNVSITVAKLDVNDKKAVDNFVKPLPQIDVLINNAGLALGVNKAYEMDPTHYSQMLDTNIKGLLHISHAVIPKMVAQNSGDIINIGSIAGHEVYAGGTVYCATKHAVDALTKGLRIDLIDTHIRVGSIDPGAVNTEFSTIRFFGDKEKADAVYKGFEPLVAQDIAEIALFMTSRPKHVQIADVVVLANAQATAKMIHRSD